MKVSGISLLLFLQLVFLYIQNYYALHAPAGNSESSKTHKDVIIPKSSDKSTPFSSTTNIEAAGSGTDAHGSSSLTIGGSKNTKSVNNKPSLSSLFHLGTPLSAKKGYSAYSGISTASSVMPDILSVPYEPPLPLDPSLSSEKKSSTTDNFSHDLEGPPDHAINLLDSIFLADHPLASAFFPLPEDHGLNGELKDFDAFRYRSDNLQLESSSSFPDTLTSAPPYSSEKQSPRKSTPLLMGKGISESSIDGGHGKVIDLSQSNPVGTDSASGSSITTQLPPRTHSVVGSKVPSDLTIAQPVTTTVNGHVPVGGFSSPRGTNSKKRVRACSGIPHNLQVVKPQVDDDPRKVKSARPTSPRMEVSSLGERKSSTSSHIPRTPTPIEGEVFILQSATTGISEKFILKKLNMYDSSGEYFLAAEVNSCSKFLFKFYCNIHQAQREIYFFKKLLFSKENGAEFLPAILKSEKTLNYINFYQSHFKVGGGIMDALVVLPYFQYSLNDIIMHYNARSRSMPILLRDIIFFKLSTAIYRLHVLHVAHRSICSHTILLQLPADLEKLTKELDGHRISSLSGERLAWYQSHIYLFLTDFGKAIDRAYPENMHSPPVCFSPFSETSPEDYLNPNLYMFSSDIWQFGQTLIEMTIGQPMLPPSITNLPFKFYSLDRAFDFYNTDFSKKISSDEFMKLRVISPTLFDSFVLAGKVLWDTLPMQSTLTSPPSSREAILLRNFDINHFRPGDMPLMRLKLLESFPKEVHPAIMSILKFAPWDRVTISAFLSTKIFDILIQKNV